MILAANQPYYLSHIGYRTLMNRADVYVVSDDSRYIDRGWVNRNRIPVKGEPQYFWMDPEHAGSNKKMDRPYLRELAVEGKMKILQCVYGRAPCFRRACG